MKLTYQTLRPLLIPLALCLGLCFPIVASAANTFLDTTLVCNNLVQVSLDQNCEALIEPDDILEGYNGNWNDVVVDITDTIGTIIDNPVTGQWVGEQLIVVVTHVPSGNFCTGHILVEDKLPPVLQCQNFEIPCYQELENQLYPTAVDNCDPNPTVNLVDFLVDNSDPCGPITIYRTFIAFDNQNNFSDTCVQVLTTYIPGEPVFPKDTIWECDVYNAYPNVTGPTKLTGVLSTTGSGTPDVAVGMFCPFTVGHTDFTISGCEDGFTILRTWTVMNWCTGEIFTEGANGEDNIQLIKVEDSSPPVIVMPPFEVGANVPASGNNECRSISFLPPAAVTDNCNGFTQRIFTPIGEAEYLNGVNGNNGGLIPQPGLPLGAHTIIYEATDACGNKDTLHVQLSVVDNTAPVAVCDEITSVALSSDGMAEIFAADLDDGSHDDCCLDSFAIKRLVNWCSPDDTLFAATTTFCCSDAGTAQEVIVRAFDCFGNYNDCQVTVNVEEKDPPLFISCPPTATVSCSYYSDSLDIPLSNGDYSVLDTFGLPELFDNCGIVWLSDTVWLDIDQCLQGTIWREWTVTDPGHNDTLSCQSSVNVEHVSDWVVQFPADVTLECGDSLPPSGEPSVFFENCELVAVSFDDDVFTVVPDACYKIQRTWTVINWCAVGNPIENVVVESSELELGFDLNGDGQLSDRVFQDGLNLANFSQGDSLSGATPDGIIEFSQIIKVIDNVAPVISCPTLQYFCTSGSTCFASITLEAPLVDDCADDIVLEASGELGSGFGPFEDVPPGIYAMNFYASDNCNNTSHCEVLLVVEDCKAPTPYCVNGLSITLNQDTSVTVNAVNFDAGSFDNCDNNLQFSFSPDVNDTEMTFDCYSLGFVVVDVYVTDDAGNQSFCETFVFVDDNQGVCQGPPLIGGKVKKENDVPVKNVTMTLNGSGQAPKITGEDGIYSFEAEFGNDYTVAAKKDVYPLNGVTTYDLVLISKHILAIDTLDSPYKIIAADANNSKTITTADMVEIRKLILQVTTKFPEGVPSWRFVPKDYVFPDPLNPFLEEFPEVISINDFNQAILDAHFVAIKVGDVNLSALPDQ